MENIYFVATLVLLCTLVPLSGGVAVRVYKRRRIPLSVPEPIRNVPVVTLCEQGFLFYNVWLLNVDDQCFYEYDVASAHTKEKPLLKMSSKRFLLLEALLRSDGHTLTVEEACALAWMSGEKPDKATCVHRLNSLLFDFRKSTQVLPFVLQVRRVGDQVRLVVARDTK